MSKTELYLPKLYILSIVVDLVHSLLYLHKMLVADDSLMESGGSVLVMTGWLQ